MALYGQPKLSETEKQACRDLKRAQCPKGATVKYTDPDDALEVMLRFVVVEDRETRVLMELLGSGMALPPQEVVDWLDVEPASPPVFDEADPEEPEENTETEPNEPEQGDYAAEDRPRGGYSVSRVGEKYLGHAATWEEAETMIRADSAGAYFPNVWMISDHGNAHRVTDWKW